MPRIVRRAILLTLALAAPALAAPDPLEAKVDPDVRRVAARGRSVPVVLLGRSQLALGPDAFAARCRAYEGTARSDLRRDVVRALRAIAGEQDAILAAIGRPSDAERLWIVNAVRVTLSPDLLAKAAALEEVRYVYPGGPAPERNRRTDVAEVIPPPKERSAFTAEGKRVPWNLERIGAKEAWTLGATGEGTVVAVLDAGVNYRHADLRGNLWRNPDEVPGNGKDDDANGLVDDLYGYDFTRGRSEVLPAAAQREEGKEHGTWTAGIVAGDGSGGTVTGVAPRARIMPVKARGFVQAALAYQYALEEGADVITMSFSVPNLGDVRGLWRLMSEHATLAGLVQVSGAGNFQQKAEVPVQIRIPEGIPTVICAGGVDERLEVTRYSSLGPVEWGSVRFYGDHALPEGLVKPDVCAFPGPRYPLLRAGALEGYLDPNARVQGNSFSGPHVAGVCALMLSAAPDLPAWRVKDLLEATCRDLGPKGRDTRTGAGLVDAAAAVRAARKAAVGNGSKEAGSP